MPIENMGPKINIENEEKQKIEKKVDRSLPNGEGANAEQQREVAEVKTMMKKRNQGRRRKETKETSNWIC